MKENYRFSAHPGVYRSIDGYDQQWLLGLVSGITEPKRSQKERVIEALVILYDDDNAWVRRWRHGSVKLITLRSSLIDDIRDIYEAHIMYTAHPAHMQCRRTSWFGVKILMITRADSASQQWQPSWTHHESTHKKWHLGQFLSHTAPNPGRCSNSTWFTSDWNSSFVTPWLRSWTVSTCLLKCPKIHITKLLLRCRMRYNRQRLYSLRICEFEALLVLIAKSWYTPAMRSAVQVSAWQHLCFDGGMVLPVA